MGKPFYIRSDTAMDVIFISETGAVKIQNMLSTEIPSVPKIAMIIQKRRQIKWWVWCGVWGLVYSYMKSVARGMGNEDNTLLEKLLSPDFFIQPLVFTLAMGWGTHHLILRVLEDHEIKKWMQKKDYQQVIDTYGPVALTRFEKHQWNVALGEETQEKSES